MKIRGLRKFTTFCPCESVWSMLKLIVHTVSCITSKNSVNCFRVFHLKKYAFQFIEALYSNYITRIKCLYLFLMFYNIWINLVCGGSYGEASKVKRWFFSPRPLLLYSCSSWWKVEGYFPWFVLEEFFITTQHPIHACIRIIQFNWKLCLKNKPLCPISQLLIAHLKKLITKQTRTNHSIIIIRSRYLIVFSFISN